MIRAGAASIRWGAGAIALSLAGHVLSLVSLPGAPGMRATIEPSRVDLVELIVEPPPPDPVVPPPVDPTLTPQTNVVRNHDARPTHVPESRPEVAPVTPEVATTTPEQAETPTITPRPIHIDPRAVAMTVLPLDGPGQPRAAEGPPDVETPEQQDARLSHGLTVALHTAANEHPEGFGPRVLPAPQRRPNGTLAYGLGQVTAIVNPDGTFTFDDTAGVHFDGMGSQDRTGGMQTSWGLEEWMMRRHGNDPHASTRRWFATQTQEMRDGMEERYMQRMATQHAARARVRLDRIMADEAIAIEERRRRVFAAWDECAEGELVGDAVRAAIITYVRANLARGTESAFPESELDSLNRSRTGTAEFRPYGP